MRPARDARRDERGAARTVWLVVALLAVALGATAVVLWFGSAEVRRLFHSPRERARILWKTRRYDEAIRYFNQVLKSDPDDVFSLRGIARCYVGKGDLKLAAAYAETAAEHDTSPLAHVLRAEIALKAAGVWERVPELRREPTHRERLHLGRATDHAKAALAIDAGHGPAHRALAEAAARLGDVEAANDHIARAIEVDPGSRSNRLCAADLLLRQGRLDDALAQNRHILDQLDADYVPALRQGVDINLALSRFDDALALCKRMAALGVDAAAVQLDLATCYLGKGDYRAAEAAADRAERKLGKRVKVPLLYWVRGTARLRLRKYDEAVIDFRTLASSREQDAAAHFQLGEAHLGSGQTNLAVDAFRKAIEIEPRLFDARLALARILAGAGRLDEALASLRRGLAAVQASPAAYKQACKGMVDFCMERGLGDLAEHEMRRLVIMEPGSADLAVLLCTLFLDRGDAEQALPVAQYAVRLRPGSPKLLHLLARAEAATGNRDLAARRFARVVRIDRTYRAAYLEWARMRGEQGRTAAAEDVYERALQALGHAPDVRVARARFLIATGRADQGVAELRDVLAKAPRELSARVALVDHLLGHGQADAALQEAKAATEALPGSVAAYSLLARVHRARGEWETFLVALRHIVERLAPDSSIGYQRLAANLHQRRYDAAVAIGRQALEDRTEHRRRIRLDLDVALFLAGQRQQAMDDLVRVLTDEPRDCDAGFLLSLMRVIDTRKATRMPACHEDALPPAALEAWADFARLADRTDAAEPVAAALLEAFVYESAGWHDVAASRCADALTIAPGNLLALRLLPVLRARAGARADAIAAAQSGCEAHPDSNGQRELLGDLLLLDGQGDRAVELYGGDARSAVPPLDLLAKRALLATARGDAAAAGAAWRAVLDYEPYHLQAANNLAWLLATQPGGNLDQAVALADKARKLAPQSPAVLDTAGWVHFRAGNDDQAIALLRKAVSGAPYRARYHFHLGMAYARRRQVSEAQRVLRQAVELDPDADFAREARQTLARLGD